MKICIFGLGKSGTTALLYKIAGGLPNCAAFSGGKPGKYVGKYKNAVYKHTYNERKGKNFELFKEHFAREHYDRYIWMARDPRDAAISRMLYRWHSGINGSKKQYQAHVGLVLKKEKDPRSVSFAEICCYSGHNEWPMTNKQVIEKESKRYGRMADFVRGLGSKWFLFNYEDMVDNEFGTLNQYLGFAVQQEKVVPKAYGKVVRKKKYGDWRQWFTEEDVRLYKPAFAPYMKVMGYNLDDWKLDSNPVIEPQYSSEYMQSLPGRVTRGKILRYIDRLAQIFFKRGRSARGCQEQPALDFQHKPSGCVFKYPHEKTATHSHLMPLENLTSDGIIVVGDRESDRKAAMDNSCPFIPVDDHTCFEDFGRTVENL